MSSPPKISMEGKHSNKAISHQIYKNICTQAKEHECTSIINIENKSLNELNNIISEYQHLMKLQYDCYKKREQHAEEYYNNHPDKGHAYQIEFFKERYKSCDLFLSQINNALITKSKKIQEEEENIRKERLEVERQKNILKIKELEVYKKEFANNKRKNNKKL